jgi:signal transduction histidine kinase
LLLHEHPSLRSEDAARAVLEVSDEGAGVPDADLSRIFNRFERAASTRHYGGLGLGLYVARQITEAHGGTIVAANVPGGGARFTVHLPVVDRSPAQS